MLTDANAGPPALDEFADDYEGITDLEEEIEADEPSPSDNGVTDPEGIDHALAGSGWEAIVNPIVRAILAAAAGYRPLRLL